MAAAAAALASGAMTPNGDIDYKKVRRHNPSLLALLIIRVAQASNLIRFTLFLFYLTTTILSYCWLSCLLFRIVVDGQHHAGRLAVGG